MLKNKISVLAALVAVFIATQHVNNLWAQTEEPSLPQKPGQVVKEIDKKTPIQDEDLRKPRVIVTKPAGETLNAKPTQPQDSQIGIGISIPFDTPGHAKKPDRKRTAVKVKP